MAEAPVQTNKIEQGFNTAGEIIAQGGVVRQIQTTYQTAVAVQQPRDIVKVEDRCIREAELAGEVCFYGWGSGQNRVEGPSVDLAMIALRNWGNCALEMEPIHETANAYIMTAHFIDLETGVTIPRQFRQSKNWKIYGNMDANRKEDVRFQIGQSKAQRNVILKSLPKWLIDKMMDKAKEGVRIKLDNYIKKNGIEAARKLALDTLARFSVTRERVEKKYGKKYGAWDIDLLVILKGDIRALTDGAESAEVLFPVDLPDEETKPEPSGLEKSMKPGDPATHQGYDDNKSKVGSKAEFEPPTKEQIFELEDLSKRFLTAGGFESEKERKKYIDNQDGKNADEIAGEINTMREYVKAAEAKKNRPAGGEGSQQTMGNF